APIGPDPAPVAGAIPPRPESASMNTAAWAFPLAAVVAVGLVFGAGLCLGGGGLLGMLSRAPTSTDPAGQRRVEIVDTTDAVASTTEQRQ
ncbi:MAG: hypothetical protein KC621_29185, partial [Myxococcales bacterium]|nr:hypothetical protein [Myxococcales bacterium]